MTVEVLTTGAALRGLRDEWTTLWTESDGAVFQSPDWLIPWWTHIGDGELLTVVVRDADGVLVGVVPLYVWTRPADRRRVVFLVGVATTDQLDGLFAPGWGPVVVAAAFGALAGSDWDEVDLQQLGPGSPLLDVAAPDGWTSRVEPGEACRALALGSPLPPKMRRTLRTCRNRGARAGVRYERADADGFERLWDSFVALHRARWGVDGMAPEVEAAHREGMPALLERGRLRLWGMWVGDRPAAAIVVVIDGGCHTLYLMAFDGVFSDLSPGTSIIGHTIERAVREGATTVDFLRGDEPYKRGWGLVERPLFRRRLLRGSEA